MELGGRVRIGAKQRTRAEDFSALGQVYDRDMGGIRARVGDSYGQAGVRTRAS